jgi:hypothetical protein
MQGIREVDVTYGRRPVLEFSSQWVPSEDPVTVESAVFDLVDLLPARHPDLFNPNELGLFSTGLYPASAEDNSTGFPAYPEPRYVVHYFMGVTNANANLRRSSAEANYFELVFLTNAGVNGFPQWQGDQQVTPVARIPLVGQQASIDSLASGVARPAEMQTGRVTITGRYLKVVAVFSPATAGPDSISCGVYLAPTP